LQAGAGRLARVYPSIDICRMPTAFHPSLGVRCVLVATSSLSLPSLSIRKFEGSGPCRVTWHSRARIVRQVVNELIRRRHAGVHVQVVAAIDRAEHFARAAAEPNIDSLLALMEIH
jgi:hypothetical protein